MRLSSNMSKKDLALKSGISISTLSRYENGRYDINNINTDILQNLAITCGKDKLFLFTPYLKFKLYKNEILNAYINEFNISKYQLSKYLDLSYTLVKSWFNKKNRSPSYDIWQTAFKKFSLKWIEQNIN
ncbi:helix-turn-helix domain-containing protein [Porcipelethomonas sp.]|uniref:helix-turn-helix domain-containing protein n=1 Tax=Porcipelethomonas sp. TaxID=2981675 RepID=UPI003EFA219E